MDKIPYDRLWIYELSGSLARAEPDPKKGFLGCWTEGEWSFLFFDRPAEKEATALGGSCKIRQRHEMSYLDWQGGQALAPFSVGDLYFRPPWVEAPADPGPDRIDLLLDPGLVFGSGNHPTTRRCLEALVLLAREEMLPERVLDLGCGTGILSLAAAGLGARVLAVDLNPLCCRTAQRNAALNALKERIRIVAGDALDYSKEPAGLLMANLLPELIAALDAAGGLAGRKSLILSGVTRSGRGRVEGLIQDQGFSTIKVWEDQATWFTFLARRDDTTGNGWAGGRLSQA